MDADELRRRQVKNLRVCLDNDDSIDPNDCVAAIETIDLLHAADIANALRLQAKTLREAANAFRDRTDHMERNPEKWLRDRADEIERGGVPPTGDTR